MFGNENKVKFNLNCIIFFLNMVLSNICYANYSEEQWKTLIVKVLSYPCDSISPVFEGSGLLIKTSQGIDILTSEHVLIPEDSSKNCYTVKNNSIGTHKVKVKRRDFSYGLAELTFFSQKIPEVKFLNKLKYSLNPSANKNLIAMGFPHGSENLQVIYNGRLITRQSSRALIPKVNIVIEASQLPIEFGMSGGVLLSIENNILNYEGMLSHQFLKRRASRQSQIYNINTDSGIDQTDIAIAIDGSEIINWQNSTAEKKINNWKRTRQVDQYATSLSFGPLNFNHVKFISDEITLGGADGSGVGGENDYVTISDNELIGIEISLNYMEEINLEYRFENALMQQWYDWLLSGETLTIVQLVNNSEKRTQAIQSFDHLITLWVRDEYLPLVYRGNINSFDMHLKNQIEEIIDLRITINKFKSQKLPLHVETWLNHLLEKLLQAENLMIQISELNSFKDRNQNLFWNEIYSINFDLSLELNIKFENLLNE